ncbi:hypothetical protein T05_16249 [Trichinella murrelli]|uniref:Uncharacterized protein n=1 Tax=Trichinella murrelli TaxID=144512 RepID=A0A0V0T286_9BILA|nr:hypothetical protein T05_16249 [Trichinella murrelli]
MTRNTLCHGTTKKELSRELQLMIKLKCNILDLSSNLEDFVIEPVEVYMSANVVRH